MSESSRNHEACAQDTHRSPNGAHALATAGHQVVHSRRFAHGRPSASPPLCGCHSGVFLNCRQQPPVDARLGATAPALSRGQARGGSLEPGLPWGLFSADSRQRPPGGAPTPDGVRPRWGHGTRLALPRWTAVAMVHGPTPRPPCPSGPPGRAGPCLGEREPWLRTSVAHRR